MIRNSYYLGFLFCLLLLVVAIMLEKILFLPPCALCILQRIACAGAGVVYLLAAMFYHGLCSSWLKYLPAVGALLFSASGALLSGRQIWLKFLPIDKIPSCQAGIMKLLQKYSLQETMLKVILGSADCLEHQFHILGISLPVWSFISFMLMLLYSCFLFYYLPKHKCNHFLFK